MQLTINDLNELLGLKKASQADDIADTYFNGRICLIRTYSAGVHFGEVTWKKGKEIRLKNARRVWYWKGAASLSQLAMEGTKNPEQCKFPCTVDEIQLEWIEVIPMSKAAIDSLKKVPVWKN